MWNEFKLRFKGELLAARIGCWQSYMFSDMRKYESINNVPIWHIIIFEFAILKYRKILWWCVLIITIVLLNMLGAYVDECYQSSSWARNNPGTGVRLIGSILAIFVFVLLKCQAANFRLSIGDSFYSLKEKIKKNYKEG